MAQRGRLVGSVGFSCRIRGREQTPCSRRPGNDTLLQYGAEEAPSALVFLTKKKKKKSLAGGRMTNSVCLHSRLCVAAQRGSFKPEPTPVRSHWVFSYNTNVLGDYENLRSRELHYSWEPEAKRPSFLRKCGWRQRLV